MNKATIAIVAGLMLIAACGPSTTSVSEKVEARQARKMECSKAVYAAVSNRIASTSPTAVANAMNNMLTSEVNKIMDSIPECHGFGV